MWKRKTDSSKLVNEITQRITEETNRLLESYTGQIELRIKELKCQVTDLQVHLEIIESNFEKKVLKDTQSFGHLTYKINSIKDHDL